MLSNREKELVTVAYYWGSADNDAKDDQHLELLRIAALEASKGVLEELGLSLPSAKEFVEYMNEIEAITQYLCKEQK